jgi:hypothetical protein
MCNELRSQTKIHAISDMPRKEKIKFLSFSPPNIYIYIYILLKTIKTCYIDKTSKD